MEWEAFIKHNLETISGKDELNSKAVKAPCEWPINETCFKSITVNKSFNQLAFSSIEVKVLPSE